MATSGKLIRNQSNALGVVHDAHAGNFVHRPVGQSFAERHAQGQVSCWGRLRPCGAGHTDDALHSWRDFEENSYLFGPSTAYELKLRAYVQSSEPSFRLTPSAIGEQI